MFGDPLDEARPELYGLDPADPMPEDVDYAGEIMIGDTRGDYLMPSERTIEGIYDDGIKNLAYKPPETRVSIENVNHRGFLARLTAMLNF